MRVYAVFSGEYENYTLDFIAVSVEEAIKHLKGEFYSEPYNVRWGPLIHDKYGWSIESEFTHVPGYAGEHTTRFDIREECVLGAN